MHRSQFSLRAPGVRWVSHLFGSQRLTAAPPPTSLTLTCCGIKAHGLALRCFIGVTTDIIVLDRESCPCAPQPDSGRGPLCSVKVQSLNLQSIILINIWFSTVCFHFLGTKGNVTWCLLFLIEILCGSPPLIESTEQVWDSKSTLGSTVLYFCKEGFYKRGGQNVSVCKENGQWSVPSLSCRGISHNSSERSVQRSSCEHGDL